MIKNTFKIPTNYGNTFITQIENGRVPIVAPPKVTNIKGTGIALDIASFYLVLADQGAALQKYFDLSTRRAELNDNSDFAEHLRKCWNDDGDGVGLTMRRNPSPSTRPTESITAISTPPVSRLATPTIRSRCGGVRKTLPTNTNEVIILDADDGGSGFSSFTAPSTSIPSGRPPRPAAITASNPRDHSINRRCLTPASTTRHDNLKRLPIYPESAQEIIILDSNNGINVAASTPSQRRATITSARHVNLKSLSINPDNAAEVTVLDSNDGSGIVITTASSNPSNIRLFGRRRRFATPTSTRSDNLKSPSVYPKNIEAVTILDSNDGNNDVTTTDDASNLSHDKESSRRYATPTSTTHDILKTPPGNPDDNNKVIILDNEEPSVYDIGYDDELITRNQRESPSRKQNRQSSSDTVREARLRRFDSPAIASFSQASTDKSDGSINVTTDNAQKPFMETRKGHRLPRPPISNRQTKQTWTCNVCTAKNLNLEHRCTVCGEGAHPSVAASNGGGAVDDSSWPSDPTSTKSVYKIHSSVLSSSQVLKNGSSRVKCGACGQRGHNRGTATSQTCSAYWNEGEVKLRKDKKEKAAEKAKEAREQAECMKDRVERDERTRQNRMAELQRLVTEQERDNEDTKKLAQSELKRRQKLADRAEKRARRLG